MISIAGFKLIKLVQDFYESCGFTNTISRSVTFEKPLVINRRANNSIDVRARAATLFAAINPYKVKPQRRTHIITTR